MATKTYRLGSGADGNFAALFEADQAAATRTDGWTVAKVGPTAWSAEFDNGTKQTSAAFSAEAVTTKPASFLTGATANAFKAPAALTGTFASGTWTATFAVRATVASSQTGRVRMKWFRSVNADGSSATDIFGFTSVGSTSAALSTTVDVTTVVSESVTAKTLTNEYLFFVIAWEIVVAGGNNSADVQLRTGQASAGTRIDTPDFTASGGAVAIPDVNMALTVT